MRFLPGLVFFAATLAGQTCALPEPLSFNAPVRGTLDERNCRMTGGAFYAEYSIVVPQVGRVEIASEARVLLRDSAGRPIDSRYLEPGEYIVVVYGAGDYELRATFTPEPGFLCRAFRRIAPDAELSGTLDETSCRTPGGAPFDAFEIRTFGPGAIETNATLRDADGLAVAPQIAGQENYWLVVGGEGGPYRLTSRFVPAEGDACAPRKLEGRASGSLSFSSCQDEGSFFEVHEFTVAEAGAVELRLSTDAWNPGVALLAASGRMLASGPAVASAYVRAGRYLAIVSTTSPGIAQYTLEAQVRAGVPATCPVLDFGPNATLSGSLSPGACRARDGLADVYRLELPSAGSLEITLSSEEVDGFLLLRDERDNVLLAAEGEDNAASLAAHLPAGVYSIVAGTPGAGGRYEIRSQFTPRPVPECTRRPRIELNGGYIGVLGDESCRGADGRPVDRYEFTLPQAGTVGIFMTSADVDGHITLEDETGRPLRRDDNSYGEGAAMLAHYLPAGTYRLSAAAADQSSGVYRLDVLFGPGDRPPGCSATRTLAPGSRVAGALHVHSCQYWDDTFADIYRIEETELAERVIEMESGRYEPQLLLLDEKGNLLEKRTGRVERALEPGVYFVVAKAAEDYTSAGAYTLTMR